MLADDLVQQGTQVKLQPNAKMTPYTRELLVDRMERLGWAVSDAAQAAGISERTATSAAASLVSVGCPQRQRASHRLSTGGVG